MRTTMTLDDDVAREINRLAGKERGAFRSVVNDLLRKGLASGVRPASRQDRFVVKAQRCGFRPGVDALKLNTLYDELEAERFIDSHAEARRSR